MNQQTKNVRTKQFHQDYIDTLFDLNSVIENKFTCSECKKCNECNGAHYKINNKLREKLKSTKKYFSYMQKNHTNEYNFNTSRAKLLNNLIRQQRLQLKNECLRLYAHSKQVNKIKNFLEEYTWDSYNKKLFGQALETNI